MKPIKVSLSNNKAKNIRLTKNNVKKVNIEAWSDAPATIWISSEKYIDYTNFQEGFIMVFDEERNRYHFISPDDFLDTTLAGESPEPFSSVMFNEIKDTINIDFGEY